MGTGTSSSSDVLPSVLPPAPLKSILQPPAQPGIAARPLLSLSENRHSAVHAGLLSTAVRPRSPRVCPAGSPSTGGGFSFSLDSLNSDLMDAVLEQGDRQRKQAGGSPPRAQVASMVFAVNPNIAARQPSSTETAAAAAAPPAAPPPAVAPPTAPSPPCNTLLLAPLLETPQPAAAPATIPATTPTLLAPTFGAPLSGALLPLLLASTAVIVSGAPPAFTGLAAAGASITANIVDEVASQLEAAVEVERSRLAARKRPGAPPAHSPRWAFNRTQAK